MKDNFEILNNVDIDLDKYEDLNIDKDKLKKNMRAQIKTKSKFKKNISVAASICLVGGGLFVASVLNPSLASGIPVIENIFEDLNETFCLNTTYSTYAQGIGQTQTKNGVTVSIEEAVSDGHNLYLTYKIKSQEKLCRYDEYEPYGEKSGSFVMYNNVKIDNDGSDVGGGATIDGYYKDEYTFVGMESHQIDFKGKESPDNYNVKIKINHIGGVFADIGDMIKGPFKFSLNIDRTVDAEVINVNKSEDRYKVRTIESSPYGLSVNIEFPKEFISKKEEILKQANLYTDKGEQVASHGYTYDGIKFNKTRVENDTVYDTLLFNYKEQLYDSKPDYIIVKFEDFYQSGEDSPDGNGIEEPQEIKETKDIEFKIDLTDKINKN